MSSIRDYIERAAECRKLASLSSNPIARQLLIETAQTWEFLAKLDVGLARVAEDVSAA